MHLEFIKSTFGYKMLCSNILLGNTELYILNFKDLPSDIGILDYSFISHSSVLRTFILVLLYSNIIIMKACTMYSHKVIKEIAYQTLYKTW